MGSRMRYGYVSTFGGVSAAAVDTWLKLARQIGWVEEGLAVIQSGYLDWWDGWDEGWKSVDEDTVAVGS